MQVGAASPRLTKPPRKRWTGERRSRSPGIEARGLAIAAAGARPQGWSTADCAGATGTASLSRGTETRCDAYRPSRVAIRAEVTARIQTVSDLSATSLVCPISRLAGIRLRRARYVPEPRPRHQEDSVAPCGLQFAACWRALRATPSLVCRRDAAGLARQYGVRNAGRSYERRRIPGNLRGYESAAVSLRSRSSVLRLVGSGASTGEA